MAGPSRKKQQKDSDHLVGSDPYRARQAAMLIMFGGVLLAAGVLVHDRYPGFFRGLIEPGKDLVEWVKSLEVRKDSDRVYLKEKKDFLKAVSKGYCEQVVLHGMAYLNRNPGAHWLRLRMAECFLIRGEPSDTESILNPLAVGRRSVREASLNSAKSLQGEAFMLTLISRLQRAQLTRARKLIRPYCQSWKLTYTCAARLFYYSMHRKSGGDAEKAFQTLKKKYLSGKAESGFQKRTAFYVYLAGAVVATGFQRKHIANKRFFLAIKQLSEKDVVSLKFLYEEWLFALFFLNDKKYVSIIRKKSRAFENEKDFRWRSKMNVLYDLMVSKRKKTVLTNFLLKHENQLVLRQDFRLLNLLGSYAARYQLAGAFSVLTQISRDFMKKHLADSGVLREMDLWRARMMLAEKKYRATLQYTESVLERGEKDFRFYFLEAVALARGYKDKNSLNRAYRSFSQSYSLSKNWQSIYGRGYVAMDLKKFRNVRKNLKIIDNYGGGVKSGRSVWRNMLEAELDFLQGRGRSGLKKVSKILKEYPDFAEGLILKAKIAEGAGQHRQSRLLMERAYGGAVHDSEYNLRSVLLSPFSPLVFVKRRYRY